MRIADYSFGALLIVIALLQINDPDPAYWVLAYGLAAAIPLLNAAGKQARMLAGASIGMIMSGMLYAATGFGDYLVSGDIISITESMDGSKTYVEPAREFLGLLIALLIVGSYALSWRRS